MDYLENAKRSLRIASLLKGQKPKTRLSRQELIRNQHIHQPRANTPNHGKLQTSISYITHKFPPSVAPISALTKTYISDLLLETNHRGSYVLLRTIAPPTRMTAVMSAVEDEKGGCEFIQLFNMSTKRDRKEILPEGQIMIIKEPFYKSDMTGGTSIRVDHVSDIIFLNPDDSQVPLKWKPRAQLPEKTALDWKEEGNTLLRCGKFHEAIECYTRGLKMDSGGAALAQILKLNRSQAFLSIGFYDKALEDSEQVLLLDPTNEKALFRGAKALYLARKFEDCKTRLVTLVRNYPENKEAKAILLKVYQRLQEERTGKYNWKEMRELTSTGKEPVKLDCADFVGPVQLQNTIESGKGLFTTRDVKFGELLLCSKAFEVCYPERDGKSIIVDVIRDRVEENSGFQLTTEVVQKLYNNPSTSKEFLELYSGTYERVQETYVDRKPVVDTFLTNEIRRLNGFGCPLLSTTSKYLALAGKDSNEAMRDDTTSSGIWVMPSFINHACWGPGSARRAFIGDMMIVRATMDMKKGEQITWSYINLYNDVTERQKTSVSNWGFVCNCCFCTAERRETFAVRQSRRVLLEKVLGFGESLKSANGLPQIVELTKSLESTYKIPPTKQPRIVLAQALEHLASIYQELGDSDMFIDTVQRMLEALGYEIKMSPSRDKVFVLRYGLLKSFSNFLTQISLTCSYSGNPQLAKSYQEVAADFYEVAFGERVSFYEQYGEILKDVGLNLVQ